MFCQLSPWVRGALREITMPSFLTDLAACAAVIYISVRFLAELRAMGNSRDAERMEFLRTLKEEREQSHEAIVRIVGLAQSMVDRCQGSVPLPERVAASEVVAVGAGVQHK